jgi:hypothetical protein
VIAQFGGYVSLSRLANQMALSLREAMIGKNIGVESATFFWQSGGGYANIRYGGKWRNSKGAGTTYCKFKAQWRKLFIILQNCDDAIYVFSTAFLCIRCT